jgi:multiple antibiotic resistance protein
MNFFSSVLTLFLVQDPIGNIPICFALLRAVPQKRHVWVIIRENLIALGISTLFLFGGNSILNHLKITHPALGISGGFILFIVAFKMIFFDNTASTHSGSIEQEPFIVPLATPLLAGPSTLATLAIYASQSSQDILLCLLSLLVVTLLSIATFLLALPLYRWINLQALQALERVMGIILITLATQMLLDNLHDYIAAHLS